MTDKNWNELERLFNAALELPTAHRPSFLEAECGDNAELLASVLEMLAHADEPAEFSQLVGNTALDWLDRTTLTPGGRVGAYRILRQIGQGGMGTVYLASRADDQFQQKVAIKVINQLAGENAETLRRFQDERQILADLHHPNITRLLDGGSLDNGSPFLIMEYVDGDRIDRFCAARQLPVDAILGLFLKVCRAVEHAHRNLVIHRDLKPSNIAIGSDGEPKLMDFGVAKLIRGIDSQDPQTLLDERVLTPLYASPEQLRGDPVTTLADVYSLGVILYELLAGYRPFDSSDSSSYAYARRVIETEPPSLRRYSGASDVSSQPGTQPDHKRRRVSRDLDNIVLKALHRDPGRRYQSASELAGDIENYLTRRPVTARAPSWPYLAQRFVQRNRLASALMLTFTITVSGLGVALWQQADLLARERDVARDQLARTSAVLALVEDMFTGIYPDNSGGEDVTVRQMLDLAGERLSVAPEASDHATAAVQAVIHRIIGATYNELGMIEPARQHLEGALTLHRRGLVDDDGEELKTLLALTTTYNLAFDLEARLKVATQALALSERLYGNDALVTLEAKGAVASANHMLGQLEQSRDQFADIYQRRRQLQGEAHPDTLGSLNSLGVLEHWLGNYGSALEIYGRCAAVAEQALGAIHTRTLRCLASRGLVLETMGRHRDAIPVLEKHISLARPVLGDSHPTVLRSLHSLADARRGLGEYLVAEDLFREVLQRRREVLGETHIETLQTEMKLARVYRLTGRYESAQTLIDHALNEEIRQQGFDHPATLIAAQEKATLLLDSGQLDAAYKLLRKILASRKRVLGAQHPDLENTLIALARIELSRGELPLARGRLERALQQALARPSFQPQVHEQILTLLIQSTEKMQDTPANAEYRRQLVSLRTRQD